jgi:hypothetical protein
VSAGVAGAASLYGVTCVVVEGALLRQQVSEGA